MLGTIAAIAGTMNATLYLKMVERNIDPGTLGTIVDCLSDNDRAKLLADLIDAGCKMLVKPLSQRRHGVGQAV